MPRADVSAGVGWFSGGIERPLTTHGGRGRDWYNDAGWVGVQGGYYWTTNLKIEGEVSWAGTGSAWTYDEPAELGGFPAYRQTEHDLVTRTLSAGLVYQFGRNLMLHPFLGGGVDVDLVRDDSRSVTYGFQGVPPDHVDERVEETRPGGFIVGGVKGYLSERAFLRADIKVGRRSDAWKVVPRISLGFDF